MINKPLNDIVEADLIALRDERRLEDKRIEYISKLPDGAADEDLKRNRIAWLWKPVASFANTDGGDLIIGVTDNSGVPNLIDGVQVANIDRTKGDIENLVKSGIEPRVRLTGVHPVRLANQDVVFVVRVPHSWSGPRGLRDLGAARAPRRDAAVLIGHDHRDRAEDARALGRAEGLHCEVSRAGAGSAPRAPRTNGPRRLLDSLAFCRIAWRPATARSIRAVSADPPNAAACSRSAAQRRRPLPRAVRASSARSGPFYAVCSQALPPLRSAARSDRQYRDARATSCTKRALF